MNQKPNTDKATAAIATLANQTLEPNAALIVAAVNQHEAHRAIALAARNLLDAVSTATPDAMTCLEGRLADALDQLDNTKGE